MTYPTLTANLNGLLELLAGALLATHLQNTVVGPDSSLHGKSLSNGICQRLLYIDILTCIESLDGYKSVPVVGRSNLNSIDILASDKVLIELIHIATLIHAFFFLPFGNNATKTLPLNGVNITACRNLHTRT